MVSKQRRKSKGLIRWLVLSERKWFFLLPYTGCVEGGKEKGGKQEMEREGQFAFGTARRSRGKVV